MYKRILITSVGDEKIKEKTTLKIPSSLTNNCANYGLLGVNGLLSPEA